MINGIGRVGAALSLAVLGGCILGGGSGSGSSSLGTLLATGTYRVSGDTLYTTIVEHSYTCDDSTHVAVPDSFVIEGATVPEFNGKARVEWWSEVFPIYDGINGLDSVGAEQYGSQYTRIGGGTGIEGTWRLVNSNAFRLVEGTPDSQALAPSREWSATWEEVFTTRREYEEYAGGVVKYWRDYHFADEFLRYWNRNPDPEADTNFSPAARHDIAATKVDKHTVRLKGRITGEVVTYRRDDRFNTRVASSLPEHPTHVYDRNVPDCFNFTGDTPIWYYEFLDANLHPWTRNQEEEELAKRGAVAPSPEARPGKPVRRSRP